MSEPRAATLDMELAANRLSAWTVLCYTLSAAAPLMVVSGVVTTAYAVTGLTALPAAFVAMGVLLGLWAVGYVAMSGRISNAGSFYAYIAQGISRPLGVAAAWIALAAYYALQVGIYGVVGAIGAPLINGWFGTGLPWWVPAGLVWLAVAGLGVARVDITGWFLGALLVVEVVTIVVYSVANIAHPADGTVSIDGLALGGLLTSGLGVLSVLAVLGSIGVEQAAMFGEESRHSQSVVRIATYATLVIVNVVYASAAWAMSQATGPTAVVDRSRAEGPELLFVLAGQHLGRGIAEAGHALLLTSMLAAAVSFHGACARYAFALGRERVLPQRLGRTSRAGAPKYASLAQSAVGAVVIVGYAAAGLDPLVQLFFWGGGTGAFGVLLLMATTSVAVIGYFRRTTGIETRWQRVTAPLIATAGFTVVLVLAVWHLDTLLGITPDHPLRWGVPAGFLTLAGLGIGWALVLRARRPDIYDRIGLGAQATLDSARAAHTNYVAGVTR